MRLARPASARPFGDTMRGYFIDSVIAGSLLLTSCATRTASNVEVAPAVLWVGTDDHGKHVITNRYAPCVVSQGVPFALDFSQHDSFTSPDTERREHYFDGLLAKIAVSASNTTAHVSGRVEYHMHLGGTSSCTAEQASLHRQTLRAYSTHFSGTTELGYQLRIGAGEDINNEPSLLLTFRTTTAPTSKFAPVLLNGSCR
jgi:hypothetical protein